MKSVWIIHVNLCAGTEINMIVEKFPSPWLLTLFTVKLKTEAPILKKCYDTIFILISIGPNHSYLILKIV